MDCIFCQIINNEKEGTKVFEDKNVFVMLDYRPLFLGHCLVMPKKHIPTLLDLPENAIQPLFLTVQQIAKALEIALPADGSFVAMNNRISQSVPHLHVHVVPRNTKDGLKGFFWPRQKYLHAEHVEEIQIKISNAIKKIKNNA